MHLLFGGPIYSISRAAIGWRFEMHRYCGPVVVDHRDEPKATQPNDGSGFWKAVTAWDRQGRQATAQDVCVYVDAGP